MTVARNGLGLNRGPEDVAGLNDPILVERLRAGDEAAFDRVYALCAADLIRFAYAYVRSVVVAQDIVAETFAYLWEQHSKLAPQYGLKAYLFAAVHNRARIALRRDGRLYRFLERFKVDPTSPVSIDTDIDTMLDTPHTEAALRQAIRSLSAERRQLVTLRWYEGLTVPQIAHVLGVSTGAVEQRLIRTLRTLRQLLEKKS